MTSWQPIETAPKDGTWVLGFCGGETLYVVMRWWDGIMPEDDDDLTTDEEGNWVVSGDISSDHVTHWIPFNPHPLAPPKTVSINNTDGVAGVRHPSRSERGITTENIMWAREYHEALSDLQFTEDLRFEELSDRAAEMADKAVPGGRELSP